MPRKLLHLLAVVFLALTIPVQGMAAVTQGQCMAFGHHQQGGHPGDHGHASDAAHDHEVAHSHSDDAETKKDDSGGKNSHCGPCVACCASASIAGPASISISFAPSTAKYSLSPWPPFAVEPDGLDRPPLAL